MSRKKQTFDIVPFMLKHHLTYEQATFWIECLKEQQQPLTFENLECIMLSLLLPTQSIQNAPGVPQAE